MDDQLTAASVNAIQLRANVAVVDMRLGVASVIPVAKIDYIDMVFGEAFLDVLNQFFILSEAFVVVDGVRVAMVKSFAEVIALQEVRRVALDRQRTDTITTAESFTKQTAFSRTFAQTLAAGDLFVKTAAFSRTFADVAVFSETFGIRDGSGTGGMGKGVVDAVALSEAHSRSVTKSRVEVAALTDGGAITSQGYADPSYFAEAYVGTLTTF